jgi:hypothetical protein
MKNALALFSFCTATCSASTTISEPSTWTLMALGFGLLGGAG